MNYSAARQHQAEHTWAYCTNGYPVGYCHPFEEWSDERIERVFGKNGRDEYESYMADMRRFAHKHHDGGHRTASEACNCYKEFLLDHNLVFRDDQKNANALYRCQAEGCENYSSGSGSLTGHYEHWTLCPEHRNRETVEKILTVGESWFS
jgi:hypothetical protein